MIQNTENEAVLEKPDEDNTYGILRLGGALLFCLSSCVSAVLACLRADFSLVQFVSVGVNVWMLLTTAYMDKKCGQFHLIILLASIIAQGICLVASGVEVNYIALALFVFILAIACFLGFALGDGLLYLCGGISLYICYEKIEYAAVLILASSVVALLMNVKRFFHKEKWRQKFPIAPYIGIGCMVAYGLSFLERFTALTLFSTLQR